RMLENTKESYFSMNEIEEERMLEGRKLASVERKTCEPAIFPPLKEIYEGNVVKNLKGSRVTAERNIHDTCTANVELFKRGSFRISNQSSLPELFISFFKKFSGISRLASEYTICTCTGRCEYRSFSDPKTNDHPLLTEDPFEQPDNAARAVSMNQLPRISEVFERTHRSLVSSNPDRNSLICGLVGRRVSSQLIPFHSNPMYFDMGVADCLHYYQVIYPHLRISSTTDNWKRIPLPVLPDEHSMNPSHSVSIRRPVSATTHFQNQHQGWEPKATR
ncbi:hypothetical protein MKW94_003472, partial [Papaver nudicaule]|nr:hypothetical protein [Papaver nudicaule]